MLKRFWAWFWTPSKRFARGSIFVVGGIAGIMFWGSFNTAMEVTNTMDFCISCHEMGDNVGPEYRQTIHFENRTGVRAECSDCHVPDPWVYKVVRKIKASNELYHWALGSIDTPEKFEDKRLTLAKHVWADMKSTDSRECRNCHSWDAMKTDTQKKRAQKQHQTAQDEGLTCIDCHKGIAHRAVHNLLEDGDDPYDNVPDSRRLISKEAELKIKEEEAAKLAALQAVQAEAAQKAADQAAKAQAAAPQVAASPASTGGADMDAGWDGVATKDVTLFYPGQASYEWIFNGKDHGGARAVQKAGDRCSECHGNEQADMGEKIVTGTKAEPTPIIGKPGSIKMTVQAKHDSDNISFRFQWPASPHAPVTFVEGGKMDPKNQIKLAVMFDDGKVELADQIGCWISCHNDSRYMPDAPAADALSGAGDVAKLIDLSNGVTKYTVASRTKIEIRGRGDKPRGGWDKLVSADELAKQLADGQFMEVLQYRSDEPGQVGYILGDRKLSAGETFNTSGQLKDGIWTVVMTRPLAAIQPGGVAFEAGKTYTLGFAIHDDYSYARFHHVSLEYRLGLDNPEAEINAAQK